MFPQAEHFPTGGPEKLPVTRISSDVAGNLVLPVLGELHAPSIELPAMPEITVHQDRDHRRSYDEVRPSWQVTRMGLELDSELQQHLLNGQFGLGAAPAYPSHHGAAFLWRHDVTAMQPLLLGARLPRHNEPTELNDAPVRS